MDVNDRTALALLQEFSRLEHTLKHQARCFKKGRYGEAMVDWKTFGAELRRARFSGPISIHVEYEPGGRTPVEKRERMLKEMRDRTFEVTQQVIDDQMRSVQEIASLLGETTAKSKVALTNLKNAMESGESNGKR